MNIAETYDRIAEDWHKNHTSDTWWVAETDAFLARLPEGGTVLDVGCGSGVKAKCMMERGFKVVGIDVSEGLLAIARRESPQGDFRLLSMYDLPTLSEQFDGVFAQASLLHIPKKDAARIVSYMAERTNPCGFVYIAVKGAREAAPDEEIKREDDYGYEYERFFSYYTPEELERYLVSAGIEVLALSSSPSGRTTWLQIVGQKPLA